MSRRPEVIVIWWRDIPTQVNAQLGRTRAQAPLHRRFLRAVDRAAMSAGLTNAHDYTREWRREARPCGDDLEAEAAAEAARIDADYPRERLQRLAAAGGVAADSVEGAGADIDLDSDEPGAAPA
jgi:hypothetical protein